MMIEKLDDSFNCLLALLLPSVLEDGQIDILPDWKRKKSVDKVGKLEAGRRKIFAMHACVSVYIARAVV